MIYLIAQITCLCLFSVAMEVIIRQIADILKGDDNGRRIGPVGENSKRVRPRKRSESSGIGNRPH